MGKKKQFINKKNAVSFHLVHRSQRDPLQADDESSKHVLMPLAIQNEKKKDLEKQKEKERQYGVFYEDDYNYMQHLRQANPECVWQPDTLPSSKPVENRTVRFAENTKEEEKPKIQLPASVFPSQKEEEVGLLNKAAPISGPRLDLDPDVVAAMDVDFDFDDPDNELGDDFVVIAQGGKLPEGTDRISEDDDGEDSEEESGEDFDSDELDDLDDDDGQRTYNSDGTKSRFTSYSLTSSVMRRTDGLTLLDDRFEKVFEQYDDLEIGALDHDEIEGHIPEQGGILQQVMEEFDEIQKTSTFQDAREAAQDGENIKEGDDHSSESEDEGLVRVSVEEPNKDRWDCESILSTYSNLYNHPKIIKIIKEPSKKENQIKLSQKTGMPLNILPKPGPTRKQLEREMIDETRLPAVVQPRQKGMKESAEEKKQRKLAIKMDRRERRVEKKFNKQAFKDEEMRQGKVMLNLKQNQQGIKVV